MNGGYEGKNLSGALPRTGGRLLFTAFISLLLCIGAAAQDLTLSGKVFGKPGRQPLANVSVYDKTSGSGIVTGKDGSFSFVLAAGYHSIIFSHLGYRTIDTAFQVSENLDISLFLEPVNIILKEVTISTSGNADWVSSAEMGTFVVTRQEIMKIPKLLGETDPLGLIRLTPGVQSGSEANVGFYVRGGGTDQNLILYDNALVYNPGHLLGFFSVFNPEIVRDVSIIKSGIPARYGGKLSSVIEVKSYKGSRDSVEFQGSTGLVASRLTVSGPLFKGKGTFIMGGRRTYMGFFVEPVIRGLVKNKSFFNKDNLYNFYDLNGGLNFYLTDNDMVSLSGYIGRDNYKMVQKGINQENILDWGNTIASLQWNHRFRNQGSWNTSLSWTNYAFNLTGFQSDYHFGLLSSASDYCFKSILEFPRNRHRVDIGLELTEHHFIPNRINATAGNFILNFGQFNTMSALEGGIFADDEILLSPKITLTAGLRISFFSHHGPYTSYVRDSFDQITDTVSYSSFRSLAFYGNPEPRIIFKYQINDYSSFKVSYMRIAQYVHLATSATVSMPTDLWVPSTSEIKPETGNQVSAGYFRTLHRNQYEFSSEVYFKSMNNKLEFLRGIIYNSIYGNIEENLVFGFGQSYGLELFLRKKTGNTTGWISYTISRTEQKFNEINEGYFYPAKYDRRHDLAVTLTRKINDKWEGSAVFIFTSGNAFTMPAGRYIIQGNIINQYGDVNQFRMPPYNRLDLSMTRKVIIRKKWASELNFSVYNVYNRANPYFIYFEATGNLEKYSLKIEARKVSLFPVIPSVSWNFVF